MKTLYIMRHAKSSWKDPTLTDHERPLNKRGQRNVPMMGKRLKKRKIKPDRVVCSDARRALDTAIPIAEVLNLNPFDVKPEPALYHASEKKILKMVKRFSNRLRRVMIVGHNPGLTEFANRFLPQSQSLANLPTAGIVELTFDIKSWKTIDSRWLIHSSVDYPKKKF